MTMTEKTIYALVLFDIPAIDSHVVMTSTDREDLEEEHRRQISINPDLDGPDHKWRIGQVTLGPGDTKHAVTERISAEIKRAQSLYPYWPTDPLHALAILGEEFGELTKEVLQATYERDKADWDRLETEAIQTAAMGIRFCLSLKKYRVCSRKKQHEQEEWK